MTTGSSDSSNVHGSTFATSVIQVTNIAPQATRDQMYTFFSFVGQVDDVRLYPSMRDASISITSRTCFVRFADPASVTITLHLNNTVFIDRAIIITPVLGNKVPEENEGLVMAMQIQQQQQQGGIGGMASNGMLGGNRGCNNDARILAANPGLVSMHPTGKIATPDAALDEAGLPPYPLLTGTTAVSKVEEIRRTITVAGLDTTVSAQQCMEFFAENAGEVKYFRYCTRDHDHVKYALIEFSERASVVSALNLNDRQLGTAIIKVIHSTESINKPQAKSNEAAAKEIEEAMSKVTEASHLVSAAVDPLMGMLAGSAVTAGVGQLGAGLHAAGLSAAISSAAAAGLVGAGLGGSGRSSMARSRSRSRRRSRSRDRDYRSRHRSGSRSRRRSKSRDRGSRRDRHRSRSRSRDRKKSSRHRSRSKESKKERKRSRSREKKRSRRSRSKEKERTEDKSSDNGVDSKGGISDNNGDSSLHKKDVDHEAVINDEIRNQSFLPGNNNGESEYEDKGGGKRRSRTKSPSRKRSKSKDRGERRKRSRSRSKDRRSRRRSSRSRSRDRKKRSRSKEKSSSKKSSRHRSKSKDRERNERKRSRSKERNRDSRTNSSKDVRSMRERSPGHGNDSRVVRDYDQEEAGFESNGETKVQDHPYNGKSKDGKLSTLHEDTRGEAMGTEDMEISNSP